MCGVVRSLIMSNVCTAVHSFMKKQHFVCTPEFLSKIQLWLSVLKKTPVWFSVCSLSWAGLGC